MTLPLPRALPADIIRANTKDEEFISTIEAQVNDIIQACLPNRRTTTILTASKTAARLCYYLLTPSGLLHRTPGEEYASVLGVHVSRRLTLPRTVIRVLLSVLRALTTDDVIWGAAKLWRRYLQITWPAGFVATLVEWFQRAHLGIFYARGRYYRVAERLTQVRYAATTMWAAGTRLGLLGWFVGLQLAFDVLRKIGRTARQAVRERGCMNIGELVRRTTRMMVFPMEMGNGEEGVGRCMMCLGGLKRPTITGCGHVFCWDCICGWCSTNVSC